MNILIGTPIHISKDYAMERWLENVAKLTKEYPADLLLVDNSPTPDYVETVKDYCEKYGLKNYKIMHIDFDQGMTVDEKDARIEASEEVVASEVLIGNYDAWFSWECDEIIPSNSLDKLIKLLNTNNLMMVVHNAKERKAPELSNPDMGVTLISRDCLAHYGFLLKRTSAHWPGGEAWFKERVFRAGGNYMDVYDVIKPINHLDK